MVEIVMDLDTGDIYEVPVVDEQDNINATVECTSKDKQSNPCNGLVQVWLRNGYYSSSTLLWKVAKDGIVQTLSLKNKHGTYSYHKHARDGTLSY
ncbi:hypothetical protein [Streptococcus hyointestinalis]|uniref:hypothetical protein n=1 Tax=Streptococcus hyointestinalis TaxID=1337 RepID=UPI0013DF093A|nr:hypothetical protein [Streptococcus hyointestinalis]